MLKLNNSSLQDDNLKIIDFNNKYLNLKRMLSKSKNLIFKLFVKM